MSLCRGEYWENVVCSIPEAEPGRDAKVNDILCDMFLFWLPEFFTIQSHLYLEKSLATLPVLLFLPIVTT